MAYASYATLSEAWGMVGDPSSVTSTPAPSIHPTRPRVPIVTFNPSPSDVDYSGAGAPILDDIVNLYTPADTGTQGKVPAQAASTAVATNRSMVQSPSDPTTEEGSSGVVPKRQPHQRKAVMKNKSNSTRKGDDYDDDSDNEVVNRRPHHVQSQPRTDHNDTTHVVELAAYVLSGVMLIFLFESFIAIGSSLRVTSYY